MHAHTRAPSGQGRLAPRGRLGHLVADAHVVAQILHMEAKRRLVGQHVYVVMVHMHAVRHLFDDDAALAVAGHDLGDEGHVLQRLLDFVDGIEIACHPQREFEGRDVVGAFDRLMHELRVAGEIQSRDGQTMLVGAVEIHRTVGHDHAHADHRVRRGFAARAEHVVVVVAAWSGQDAFAV